jgi:Domain of unknown function (DUF4157)
MRAHAMRSGKTASIAATPGFTPTPVRHRLAPNRLQARSAVDRPGDRFEREADRVAAQVVAQGVSRAAPGPEGAPRTPRGGGAAAAGPVAGSSGRPLDAATRAFMEPRFGYDFSQVRVHTDARADAAAASLGAVAFTAGSDIAFRSGEYAPETAGGRRLLAHELTHVVQQSAQQSGAAATPAVQRQTPSPEPEPPRFPDVPGLLSALDDDIGENLFNYGHHFYRLATLYPDRPDLLQQAFGRYALGANVLETAYQFIGAEPGTAEALALGTGILFKGFNFVRDGELVIDYQFDLGRGVKLEAGLDLAVDPEDLTDVKKVEPSLSLVGHF